MLTALSLEKQHMLTEIIRSLEQVNGVAGIALGGSYALGAQRVGSDLDIAIYYHESHPFAIANIQRVVDQICVQPAQATQFYGWGHWVNGGAWIITTVGKVDFLYRNLEQIEQTIIDAEAGQAQHDYDQQPTHGFYNVIYLAEIQVCLPLYDPRGELARLKQRVAIYPERLRQTILKDSLWQADFSLIHAQKFAENGDIYNCVGCLTRISASLTQALFAMNRSYFLSDKHALQAITRFQKTPIGYASIINQILSHPGRTTGELVDSVASMRTVWQDVVDIAGMNNH
jgi:predicted nucleotidyltransferase